MLVPEFATILARTDPFDVAQGLERYIRTLSADDVRALIVAAAPRMNEAYRGEFLPLVEEPDAARLKSAFAHALKSNLRAIPLFGPEFCGGVISRIPADRTVGLGEERRRSFRVQPLALAAIAVVLLIGAAAAQRVLSTARTNADAPAVIVTPGPVAVATAVPLQTAAPARTAAPATPHPVRRTPRPAVRRTAAPPVVVARAAAALPAPVERPAPPVHRAAARHFAVRHKPPTFRGVKTVVLRPPTPRPTPVPTPIDVSDMPRAYTDATPLPRNAAPPASVVPRGVTVSVPTPEPTEAPRGSWLHRTVMHLDPVKPHTGGWIHNSIMHLDPFKPHGHAPPSGSPSPSPSPSPGL